MSKEREALQKIVEIIEPCEWTKELDEIKDIATEALEQSEPRMFSEEEVIGFGIWLGEKYWVNLSTYKWECRNEEGLYEVLDSKRLIELYIQSLPPKEGKEEARKFVYLIEDTHPSRQGLWWGLEEVPLTSWETGFKAWTNDPLKAIQFDTFEQADEQRKKLNMDGYIVTEHEFVEMPPHEKVDSKPSLEPNQTEAEKEGIKGFLNSHLVPLDIKSAQFHFNQGRLSTIQEIEKFVKKESISATDEGGVFYENVIDSDYLLTKLKTLKP